MAPFEVLAVDDDVTVVDDREVLVDGEGGERGPDRPRPLGRADATAVAAHPFVTGEADERGVGRSAGPGLGHDAPEAPVPRPVAVAAPAPREGSHAHPSCPSRMRGSIGTRTPRSAATSAARE